MTAQSQRLQAIEDKFELGELVSKYAWYVGQCAPEEVVSLFCEDGAFLGLEHQVRGRAALSEFYTRMLQRRSALPYVVNKLFEVDGDTATGNASLIAFSGDSGLQTVCGYYDDVFVREDGSWRFKTRRFSSYLSTMRIQAAAGAIGPTAPPSRDESAPEIEQFRAAMRHLAASVHVVTTLENDQRWGLTATAVASFSADPPAMIVCVNKAGHAYGPILRSRRLGINLLADDQQAIADRFSGASGARGEARFADLEWSADGQSPLLAGAVANFDCEVCDVAEYFTHAVLICRIKKISLNEGKRPLIYHDRAYAGVAKPS